MSSLLTHKLDYSNMFSHSLLIKPFFAFYLLCGQFGYLNINSWKYQLFLLFLLRQWLFCILRFRSCFNILIISYHWHFYINKCKIFLITIFIQISFWRTSQQIWTILAFLQAMQYKYPFSQIDFIYVFFFVVNKLSLKVKYIIKTLCLESVLILSHPFYTSKQYNTIEYQYQSNTKYFKTMKTII
jgi:hypothetical protein